MADTNTTTTRTASNQVYTATNASTLGVSNYFTTLMAEAVGSDSIYIRTKETLQAFLEKSDLTSVQKTNILAEALVSMTTSITAQAMNVAVEWAKADQEASAKITKIEEETLLLKEQRDKVAAENLLINAQIKQIQTKTESDKNFTTIQGWKLQAEMVRDYGLTVTPTITEPVLNVANIGNKGVKYEQEQQIKASVYATFAKSFRESGVVHWTLDADGRINTMTDAAPANPGLTKAQEKVALRQEKAFDDNMRQHAANSSANMIGLLLSAESAENVTPEDVDRWRTAIDYLNKPTNSTNVSNS